MNQVVYIAGAMSGIENFNREAFFEMQEYLEGKAGFAVLNPATLPDGLEQSQYMDICLAMVRSSHCLVMLKGWRNSAGATAEYYLAEKLGKIIFDLDEIEEIAL